MPGRPLLMGIVNATPDSFSDGGRSPDECDACALAALAVKERLGLLPFGFLRRLPEQDRDPGSETGLPVVQLLAPGAQDEAYDAQQPDGEELFEPDDR